LLFLTETNCLFYQHNGMEPSIFAIIFFLLSLVQLFPLDRHCIRIKYQNTSLNLRVFNTVRTRWHFGPRFFPPFRAVFV
jgi:hypothetical protein